MRIKKLHIMDFGILRNQTLAGLNPGMVVVGGFNRAGKTTFLNVLRHLFYGIKRSASLPPPAQEYRIEADLRLEKGQEASVRINGYSQPEFFYAGGKKADSISIIGEIDDFTYQRIFTINLSELRSLPEGVSGAEAARLQSVLLGAGLADVAAIPQICAELRKVAEGIGGKKGSPGVRLFKESNEAIRKGLQWRAEALDQITEFEETQKHLAKCREEIALTTEAIQLAEAELTASEFLNQYFEDYQELTSLTELLNERETQRLLSDFAQVDLEKAARLHDAHQTALKEYKTVLFQAEVALGFHLAQYRRILENRGKIREGARQSAGVRQRFRDLAAGLERQAQEEARIKLEISEVNQDWDGEFAKVKTINCDQIRMSEVRQSLTEFRALKERIAEERRVLEEGRRELEITKKILSTLTGLEPRRYLGRFFVSTFTWALGGYLLTLVRVPLGFFIGIGGILASGLHLLFSFFHERELREQRRKVERDYQWKEQALQDQVKQVEGDEGQLWALGKKLREYQRILGLPEEEINPELIQESYRRTSELRRRIGLWEEEAERLSKVRTGLERELSSLGGLAVDLRYLPEEPADYIGAGAEILESVEEIAGHLELLGKLEDCEGRLLNLRRQAVEVLQEGVRDISGLDLEDDSGSALASASISASAQPRSKTQDAVPYALRRALSESEEVDAWLEKYLNQGEQARKLKAKAERAENLKRGIRRGFSPRVRQAFQLRAGRKGESGDERAILEDAWSDSLSSTEADRRCQEAEKSLAHFRGRLDQLKEDQTTLENELKMLATSEKLEEAQRIIDQARSRLEPLARKYAVHSLAVFILDELRKAFLKKTKGELLGAAGKIFAELTGKTYKQILPADDLLSPDFKTVTGDGAELDETALLSRGTKEQLFLSVRLSRIQELRPAMPVILDDSLVNFDVRHTRQAVQVLSDLARTHQIFILTCHPEMIEYIAEVNSAHSRAVQYWRIARGNFDLTGAKDLISYLRGETLGLL